MYVHAHVHVQCFNTYSRTPEHSEMYNVYVHVHVYTCTYRCVCTPKLTEQFALPNTQFVYVTPDVRTLTKFGTHFLSQWCPDWRGPTVYTHVHVHPHGHVHVCFMRVCSISADIHVQMKFTGTETCRDFPSHVIIDMECGLHGLSFSM